MQPSHLREVSAEFCAKTWRIKPGISADRDSTSICLPFLRKWSLININIRKGINLLPLFVDILSLVDDPKCVNNRIHLSYQRIYYMENIINESTNVDRYR